MHKPRLIMYLEGIVFAFALAGFTLLAFVIGFQHEPVEHVYTQENRDGITNYLLAMDGDGITVDKPVHYTYSTAADVFGSYLPGEKK